MDNQIMSIQYVKRLQMVFDFTKTKLAEAELPQEFRFISWDRSLLEAHADVKHRGFRNDSDGEIFPTFRSYDRCLSLMQAIAEGPSFLPEATLLIAYGHRDGEEQGPLEYVANIQGMRHAAEVGAIQNVAVLPDFRGRGIGRALVLGSLRGFRGVGVDRVTLEVTADNNHAVRLYQHIGFTTYKVYFREIYRN